MEDYIACMEQTLSELTGERALGEKIAANIADCCKLDLLQELQAVDDDNNNNNNNNNNNDDVEKLSR